MNILITILLVLAGIIALLLIAALFIKKEHYVKREVIVLAPRQQVFDFVKLLKNQELFNRHAMADADRDKKFKGTDGTVGFVYAWSGNKDAGQGEKEIMNLVEGSRIETQIRFVKPMVAVANVVMETESLPGDQTRVSWSNKSALRYPLNIFVPMIEKMLAKDMDKSLQILKALLEKPAGQ